MDNKYIALLDSGIGGISLLTELWKLMPDERFLYFGDNDNAPYGNRTERNLLELSIKNINYIMSYGVKILVLACNTLSTTLLHKLEYYAGVKTFGVYPPVEGCVMRGEKTLLLCTPLTAQKYDGVYGAEILGIPRLAEDIEKNKFSPDRVDIEKNLLQCDFYKDKGIFGEKYDTVILGCTHYVFIKNKIIDHFRPRKVVCGNEFTAAAIKRYLEKKINLKNISKNQIKFIGKNAEINQDFFFSVVNNVVFE